MKTPAQYQHQIAEFDVEKIKVEGATPAEIQAGLDLAQAMHDQLREIERSLNLDLHALRSQFQGKEASINLMNQRRMSGKRRAEEEQRLQEVEQGKLAPYEEVKKALEALLAGLEEKRSQLESAPRS